jgi:formylglycine-generating enzyme required for sulfatase activity
MKIVAFLLLLVAPLLAHSNEPEIILPKTKVIRTSAWYSDQVSLWRSRIASGKTDGTAWLNYYVASKYATVSESALNAIVSEMESSLKESFERNLIEALHRGYTASGFAFLTKAHNTYPTHPATYASLAIFGELHHDRDARMMYAKKLFDADQLSSSLLHYSYNVLMSVEPNAVLITEGDNTSIPLYVLQDVFGYRKDVTVLQLELLADVEYRRKVFQQLGISFDETQFNGNSADQLQLIPGLLSGTNPGKKFYVTLTLSPENLTTIKDQLYVVGLASQVSHERMNNIPVIRENLENKFLLDYLTVDFNGENEFATGKIFSANYLVPMLMLHEHYVSVNDHAKAEQLRLVILKLAAETGKEKLVNNLLQGKFSDIPYFPFDFELKKTEGIFKKIKDKIYAQEYEVTNAQYNQFLNYLKRNKLDAQYEKYTFALSQYEEPSLSFMRVYSADRVPMKKDRYKGRYFDNYPAVSISHESAVAYCDWLTEQYNHQEDRKFKKVKFRLPSIKEWQIAALGYDKFQSWELDQNTVMVGVFNDSKSELSKELKPMPVKDNEIFYPWYKAYNYRNKPLNSRGCSLGNFKFPENECGCGDRKIIGVDGFVMMSPVQSYFPNGMGLYDVVGNVAEMTDEKGKACGGSWNHTPQESTIRSVNPYEGPDVAIGFRVFMEVIEP